MSAPASPNNNLLPGSRPIIVAGPTGVGKSAFALALAERVNGEIIGADAFQIYAGLPLLTAQPSADFQARIPHHLIGILPLDAHCDAALYTRLATDAIRSVQSRNRTPILVGGTGLYIKALTHGLAPLPPVDSALRQEISNLSLPEALARLAEQDPQAPAQIDIQNPVRVRRALEIVRSTRSPLAASRRSWQSASPEFRGIVLQRHRDELRARVIKQVETMFDLGVVEEVRAAASHVGPTASRAIGFREIQNHLAGSLTLAECQAQMITATMQYAKRQTTWFRNQFPFPTQVLED